jgi:stearoyl-CoA desaturase (delta-9 desaturase)
MDVRPNSLRRKVEVVLHVFVPPIGVLLAVRLLWERATSWGDIALLAALYVPVFMGMSVGYHRYLTHRSFKTYPAVKALLLVLGSMALQGHPILWVANHRKHHALSDRDGDIHSPVDGFFHAHLGWMMKGYAADHRIYARDLHQDPLVVWISRQYVLWALLTLAIPLMLGGWSGLLWGGFVRVFLVHHVTFSVASICHTFGTRPYRTRDRSGNVWLMGVLALGEGWHNNHHAFPRSAVHGLEWWQFDLSGLAIRLMERLGLVWDVQRTRPADRRARSAYLAVGR